MPTTATSDIAPPDTNIDEGPEQGSTQNDRAPEFAFSSAESGSSFECRVYVQGSAPAAFQECSGPGERHSQPLGDGGHVFQVRAIDMAGNVDPSPAERAWIIDATPPKTRITGSSKNVASGPRAILTFASEPDATFQCSLDGDAWRPCDSPTIYKTLEPGKHVFEVRSVDLAGNADPTPARRAWKTRLWFDWPTAGPISSRYESSGSHDGVDIDGECGQPIRAGADGRVVFSGWRNGYGNTVTIRHGDGFSTLYAHQPGLRVSKGKRVSAGERIGSVGTTGWSTGCHLHFEVLRRGKPVNPMPYLKPRRRVRALTD